MEGKKGRQGKREGRKKINGKVADSAKGEKGQMPRNKNSGCGLACF